MSKILFILILILTLLLKYLILIASVALKRIDLQEPSVLENTYQIKILRVSDLNFVLRTCDPSSRPGPLSGSSKISDLKNTRKKK